MRTKIILPLLILLSALQCYSQSIKNVDFVVRGNKIIITFDMFDFSKENNYDISIKFVDSTNNFIVPQSGFLSSDDDGIQRIDSNSKHRYNDGLTINAGKNIFKRKEIRWFVSKDIKELYGNYQAIIEVQSGYYSLSKNNIQEPIIKAEGRSNFKNVNILPIKVHIPDSVKYKNGIDFNLEALIVNDFKLTYTHKLKRRLYLELMVSYNFPLSNKIPHIYSDPYYNYGRFQIRAGIKVYLNRKFYFGGNLLFNYGKFTNKNFFNANNGEDFIKSRVKHDYEIFFKVGWTSVHKWFLIDYYLGIGLRDKFLDDNVIKIPTQITEIQIPPYHESTTYGMIELHAGIQIGFCK